MAKIIVTQNHLKIREIELSPGLNTIGRAKDQKIMINDDNVTRNHAVILGDTAGKIFIYEDLNSMNGSIFNREKISRRLLSDGDTITVGIHQLTFKLDLP